MSEETKPFSQADIFPSLNGTSLESESVVIPPDSAAELTLLMLGFTHAAGQQMEPWVERFKRAFGGQQLDYYKIAMVGGIPDHELDTIVQVMISATPPEERPHVLAVRGDPVGWRRRFGVQQQADAYLFLLDRAGVVRWKGVGSVRDESFDQLVSAGRAVLGQG